MSCSLAMQRMSLRPKAWWKSEAYLPLLAVTPWASIVSLNLKAMTRSPLYMQHPIPAVG